MHNRREFLGSIALPLSLTACSAPLLANGSARRAESVSTSSGTPDEVASDEDAWREVQQAFTCDRSMINLNNGGVCPAPLIVQEALRRHLEQAQLAPAYVMWRLQEPQKETVRIGLARLFGCDPEEIAITRNASESLENVQLGLHLERGDEVLTSDEDYPRMMTTWEQRARREGIVLVKIELPVPALDEDEVVRRFEAGITPKTRVIHMCHVINLTGQILPVKKVVTMAKKHGIQVIVDGAHAFGHLDFKLADLDCDYYGTSLHKFLYAPIGTGMLFVRRAKIPDVWPLMPAPKTMDADIRKFEEIGTHMVGLRLAIADAVAFQEAIGPARKEARLRYLRDRWAKRVEKLPRVKLHSSLQPGHSTGVATVEIEGVKATALTDHLWAKQRIFTVGIEHPRFQGVRVSPSLHNTLSEIDRFADALEKVAREGLPAGG